MNKKTLTTAVLAGLTGIAGIVSVSNAVHINPDNTGQVLLYPYYTTRGDNVTLISVVNTTSAGKALKVRFIEGVNSREVRDFNLYLSPFDVWTANISDNGSGGQFVTRDNSCTAPQFFDPATGTSAGAPGSDFTNLLYADEDDFGPFGLDRTREGYVEIIEMGTVTDATEGSLTALTHTGPDVDANGDILPADCDQIESAWINNPPGPNSYWVADPQTDMAEPTGGLFGDGTVVNVPGARAFGYNATALDAFYVPDLANPVSLHNEPGNTAPDLFSAFPATSNTILATGSGAPVVVSDTWGAGVQAVTAVLTTNQVMNQYDVDDAINGQSEWVVTHPTKRFHVYFGGGPGTPIPPFTQAHTVDQLACEEFNMVIWDRNELERGSESGTVPPSPNPGSDPDITQLCFETNVISFNDSDERAAAGQSAILGSKLDIGFDVGNANNIPVPFQSGWGQASFAQTAVNGTNEYVGLPVVGFGVRTADNAGINALFGAAFEHAYARVIQSASIEP